MRSILFEIPYLHVRIFGYGFMLCLALLAAMSLAAHLARRSKLDPNTIYDLALWLFVGGIVGARLYNKTREIEFSGKHWVKDLWRPVGWVEDQEVWRLEFEFKREFLKEHGLGSLDTVLDHLDGLWSYATTEWLRLTFPNEADATRSRWPTHDLWQSLSALDWASSEPVRLTRFSNRRIPDKQRLYGMVHGSLATYMAIHRIDSPHEAMEGLLGEMHEHFQRIALAMDMDAEELLLRKARARAREFNTNDNRIDGPEDETPGMRAYRKATGG